MKDMPAAEAVIPPQPRDYHGFNWAGFGTLYAREVRRFWKVGMQTLAAPVVTALLYMMVFVVAVQGARPPVHGTAFSTFVAPGLIISFWAFPATADLGWGAAMIYVVCCVLRLARFNVGNEVAAGLARLGKFQGVPSPAGAMLVMLPSLKRLTTPMLRVLPVSC